MNNTKYLIILAALVILITAGYWKVQLDDAYIYYSYAKNIAEGNGFAFNPGEKINAATSPLYTLLLAGLYTLLKWTGITIPAAAHLAGGLCLFFTAFLLFRIFNKDKYHPAQYFIPLLFLANPLLKNSTGMEMFLVLFLVTFTFYWFDKNNILLTGLFGALAVLARPDASLCLLAPGIILLLRKEYRSFLLLAAIVLIFISPWYLFSYLYFGELFPSSLKIKMLQQSIGYWGTGLIFLKGIFQSFPGDVIPGLFFLLLLFLSFVISFIKRRDFYKNVPVVLFLSWVISYLLVYSFIINPPAYPWYYTPLSILAAVIISAAVCSFPVKRSGTVIIISLIFFAAALVQPIKTFTGQVSEKYIIYKSAAGWINENSGNPVVAIDEIGIIRFYLEEGNVRDILGLSNPESAPFIINKDLKGFIKFYEPDFIITESGAKPAYMDYTNSNEFKKNYREVKRIKGYSNEISIFSKD